MRKLVTFLLVDLLENKIKLLYIAGLLLLFALIAFIPIHEAHPNVFIYELINLTLVVLFFLFTGALGISFIWYREALVIFPLRGIFGILIGVLLTTGSIYLIYRFLTLNLPILHNLWLGN
jgi:hypothetical protein